MSRSSSPRPPAAYDAQRGRVVLFGGSTGGGETWVYDGDTWTRLQPDTRPPARRDHTMAYDAGRDRIVLFGGRNSSGVRLIGTTFGQHIGSSFTRDRIDARFVGNCRAHAGWWCLPRPAPASARTPRERGRQRSEPNRSGWNAKCQLVSERGFGGLGGLAIPRLRTLHRAGSYAIPYIEMPDAPDLQQERFRRMTPAEKLRAAERLYWSARALKRAMLRSRHPLATGQELDRMVRDAFLHART